MNHMSDSDYTSVRWTVEAGLGFGALADPRVLRPEEHRVDVLRAGDELKRKDRVPWETPEVRPATIYQ